MEPTNAQIEVWQSFKAVAKRADLEIRATQLTVEQLAVISAFYKSKNMPPMPIGPLLAKAAEIHRKNERLKEVIIAVELEKLGLRFEDGDIDIMAPPGTNSDVIAQYQLNGLPIIIVGIAVGVAIIAYIAALRQQNAEVFSKLSALKDDAESMLCAEPSSAQCTEWKIAKESAGYDRRENAIDQVSEAAENLPDTVKKLAMGAGIGIAVAVLGAAAYLLWNKKNAR